MGHFCLVTESWLYVTISQEEGRITMEQAPGRFLEVYMDHNNKCNLTCRMCGFSDPRVEKIPKYDMPVWLFEKIAREVFPSTKYLALSCLTEPLMTKDFPERLAILKDFEIPVTEFITNGTLLSRETIHRLLDNPVTRIGVSLDGASPETYETIRAGAKFEKVISNLRMLNEMKRERGIQFPHLRLLHVISETNVHEFPDFLRLVESLGAQSIDVRTITPFQNAADRGTSEKWFWNLMPRYREMISDFTRRTGIEDSGYLRHQEEEITLHDEEGHKVICRRPWTTMAIHPDGEVFPCISWTRESMGNLAQQSFEEIWNGVPAKNIRREFEKKQPGVDCTHCTIKKGTDSALDDDFFYLMLKKSAPPRRQ